MSAFSRGLLRPQCLLNRGMSFIIQPPSRSFLHKQSFSSTPFLHATKKARPSNTVKKSLSINKPSHTPTKSTPSPPLAAYQSYASKLAQLSRPTLLYQAPSHTGFIISSYTAGALCITYAVVTFWGSYLYAPSGLAAWIAPAYGGVCIAMVALGGYLILGPTRVVNNITAIPTALLKNPGARSQASAGADLTVEVRLRKMFPVPFFPARKLYVRADEISLPLPLAPVDTTMSAAARKAQARLEAYERQQEREYERSHIMTAPFRHASQAFYNLFASLRRAWTRDGFMKLKVKGQVYKLDITGGWALDGGRALDRLVVVQPRGGV
jgi:hypothetical protein